MDLKQCPRSGVQGHDANDVGVELTYGWWRVSRRDSSPFCWCRFSTWSLCAIWSWYSGSPGLNTALLWI